VGSGINAAGNVPRQAPLTVRRQLAASGGTTMMDEREGRAARMRIGNSGDGAFARRVLIMVAILGLALLLWYLIDVLLLIFAAVLVAILLRAIARPIDRHTGIGDNWALASATLFVTLVITLTVFLFGAEIRAQTIKVADTLPTAWDLFIRRILSGDLRDQVVEQAEESMPAAGQILANVLVGAWSVAGALGGVVLLIVGGLYLAAQPEIYRGGFLLLFPDDGKRARAKETLDATAEALQLWLIGQLLTMAFILVVSLVGLWAIGLPAAVALAVFAGLAQFVPILGPIVASVPALLVALTESWQMVLWVLALYIVIQQVESNVVTPLVQRRTVDLPPALPLFAVVVFGLLFGLPGVLLATPLAVVAFVAIKKLWVRDMLGETTMLPGEEAIVDRDESEATAAVSAEK
jgi:predicted PurR-regulated permease PerM